MARRAHAYPQVRLLAADLVDRPVAAAPGRPTAEAALARARKADAAVVALGGRALRFVLREDLARAAALGLGRLPAGALVRPLGVVPAAAGEVEVRRRTRAGTPVVVLDRGRPLGSVTPPVAAPTPLGAAVLAALPAPVRAILAAAGEVAAARRARAFAVGGLVRELLRGRGEAGADVDLAVEGDGVGLARALAERTGGGLVEHARFLTASVTGTAAGRVDVATCRAEWYETPGALPRVLPASIQEDLRRRDFAVNALALDLAPGAGGLLDPLGGRDDLARRRLRVLHPLSFVEDPTRVFRAARYAARLGFGLDAWTARALALALRLAPYPALSGERLATELARILADRRPARALGWLGRHGALRLLDARHRFDPAAARLVDDLPAALAWSLARGVAAAPLELAALALAGAQPPEVGRACLARLGFTGEPRARLGRALEASVAAARLTDPVERARRLAGRAPVELAWLWLGGDARVRAAVDWFATRAPGARPALRGDDVIALGVARGPAVARVLEGLRAGRVAGTLRDRAGEEAFVRAWARDGGEGGDDGKEG